MNTHSTRFHGEISKLSIHYHQMGTHIIMFLLPILKNKWHQKKTYLSPILLHFRRQGIRFQLELYFPYHKYLKFSDKQTIYISHDAAHI